MATVGKAELAVNGGAPVRSKPWPQWPEWDEDDIRALADVVRSGKWFAHGGETNPRFAERWAEYQHARFCTPLTNGTHALEIALRAAGVKAGDEVIVPPYTFIATASAVVNINAVPVFADIDPTTLNLDPAAAEAAITERTTCLLPVHVAGLPADLDGFSDLARRRGLLLIEDAAQAHGAEWRGRRVGAHGRAGTFSFQASKNLNAGEGGAIVTDDESVFDRAWSLINVGRKRVGGWYEHETLSGNYRMTEFQAGLLLSQMRRLDDQTGRRSANGDYLAGKLAQIEGIMPARRDERVTRHAYHLFVFKYRAEAFGGMTRDDFIQALTAEGVPCSRGYQPLYRSDAFRVDAATHPFAGRFDYGQVRLPEVERVAEEEAVWLTQRMLLATREDMDDVVAAVRKIQEAVTG